MTQIAWRREDLRGWVIGEIDWRTVQELESCSVQTKKSRRNVSSRSMTSLDGDWLITYFVVLFPFFSPQLEQENSTRSPPNPPLVLLIQIKLPVVVVAVIDLIYLRIRFFSFFYRQSIDVRPIIRFIDEVIKGGSHRLMDRWMCVLQLCFFLFRFLLPLKIASLSKHHPVSVKARNWCDTDYAIILVLL